MVLVRPESFGCAGGGETGHAAVKVKEPKRILHFCDGTLEEYSSDEDENDNSEAKQQQIVDPVCLLYVNPVSVFAYIFLPLYREQVDFYQ